MRGRDGEGTHWRMGFGSEVDTGRPVILLPWQQFELPELLNRLRLLPRQLRQEQIELGA